MRPGQRTNLNKPDKRTNLKNYLENTFSLSLYQGASGAFQHPYGKKADTGSSRNISKFVF